MIAALCGRNNIATSDELCSPAQNNDIICDLRRLSILGCRGRRPRRPDVATPSLPHNAATFSLPPRGPCRKRLSSLLRKRRGDRSENLFERLRWMSRKMFARIKFQTKPRITLVSSLLIRRHTPPPSPMGKANGNPRFCV